MMIFDLTCLSQGTEEEVEIKSTEMAEMRHVEIGKTMMFMRVRIKIKPLSSF